MRCINKLRLQDANNARTQTTAKLKIPELTIIIEIRIEWHSSCPSRPLRLPLPLPCYSFWEPPPSHLGFVYDAVQYWNLYNCAKGCEKPQILWSLSWRSEDILRAEGAAGSSPTEWSTDPEWSRVKSASKQKVVNIFATALGKNKGCWDERKEPAAAAAAADAECSKGSNHSSSSRSWSSSSRKS